MTRNSRSEYSDPVARLLSLGKNDTYRPENGADYPARFAIPRIARSALRF